MPPLIERWLFHFILMSGSFVLSWYVAKLCTSSWEPYRSRQVNRLLSVQFSSVTQLCPTLCNPMGCSTTSPPCSSPTPGVHLNSCVSSAWCHPVISSSVVPLSSCPQSLPASGSFPMSQLFESGGQRIGVSASASVLPMNIQGWFTLGCTGWISLQSKGLSRVFNTTVQKH